MGPGAPREAESAHLELEGQVSCGGAEVPAPFTGGTVDRHGCPKPLGFRNLLGAQTGAQLGQASTCPAGESVRARDGEAWGLGRSDSSGLKDQGKPTPGLGRGPGRAGKALHGPPLVPLAAHRGGRPLRPGDLALPLLLGGPGVLPTQCSTLCTAGPVPGDGGWAGHPLQSPHYLPGEVGGPPLGAPSLCPRDCPEPRPLSASQGQAPSAQPDPALGFSSSSRLGNPGTGHCLGRRRCWGTATPCWATRPMSFLSGSVLGAPSVKVDSVQPRAPGAAVASRLLLCPRPRCSEAFLPRKHGSHPGRGGQAPAGWPGPFCQGGLCPVSPWHRSSPARQLAPTPCP